MSTESTVLNIESPAVALHINVQQSVIQRMASNSAACKTWCVTIVSAILIFVADKGKPNFTLIAGVPAVLFLILDAYYLALERGFRESYNIFVKKLHLGKVDRADMFLVSPALPLPKTFVYSLLSFSIWPFYLTLGAMIIMTRCVVSP